MAFRKPKKSKIGGKFLVYGFAGEGKTFFGLTFPNIAAVDSETGLGFYEDEDIEINGKKYNNLVLVDTTSDLDELEENLDALIDGELEGIDTFLIDSETKFYISMDIGATEVEERKAKAKGKEVDTRSKWGRVKNINMKMQQAKITASAMGVHVVSVAQGKTVTDDDNKVIGYTMDAHKSLSFDYDTVLRFYTETNKQTKERKYYAEVIKDRTRVTKVGDIIENCTYDIWKSYFDARNGLETSGANFRKDLNNSTTSVLNDAEQSVKLAEELKTVIKKAGVEKKQEIKEILKDLEIDIKNIDISTPEVIKKAIDQVLSL